MVLIEGEEHYSVKETAGIMGLKSNTIRGLMCRGELKARKLTEISSIKIAYSEIENKIRNNIFNIPLFSDLDEDEKNKEYITLAKAQEMLGKTATTVKYYLKGRKIRGYMTVKKTVMVSLESLLDFVDGY